MLLTSQRELADCLEEVAEAIRKQVNWHVLPVDAEQIALRLGMVVAHDRSQKERGRRVQLSRGARPALATIVLAPDPRPERRQWAVAHEIGEQFAGKVLENLGESPAECPRGMREEIASGLAGRLLLPRAAFHRASCAADWDLSALKQKFSTASHELIARRMLDFEPQVIVSIFDQGKLRHRWTNVKGVAPRLSNVEQIAWQVAHVEQRSFDTQQQDAGLTDSGSHAESEESSWRISRIQAWPIHEGQWQREILRTTVEGVE